MSDKLQLASRLWQRDASLWSVHEPEKVAILNRLGWLDAPGWICQQLGALKDWVADTLASGQFQQIVVLGMGGSSLAPEVLCNVVPSAPGFPSLSILDSTAPEMVRNVLEADLKHTLFIVASKSGTTLETADLYRFFFHKVGQISASPGDQFVAITDQDSWLQGHAEEMGFRHTFINPSDIGGRYSALSYFGMVPAALCGLDVTRLLDQANAYTKTTQNNLPDQNDALALGIFLGQQALMGRDKMQLEIADRFSALGIWIEQLVAESTGKLGKGILPVCTSEGAPSHGGDDVFYVRISDGERGQSEHTTDREINWSITDPLSIGAEFFKWEFATAIAAHYLGINPFDEPNVAEAKNSTNRFIKSGEILETSGSVDTPQFELHQMAADESAMGQTASAFFAALQPGNYISLLAYLPIEHPFISALENLRQRLSERYGVACTVGFGPRYLHSTGQLHKGGASTGCFVQFISESVGDYDVPESGYSFSQLLRAQADGDISVLASKGLPVMRVRLKGDRLASIAGFADAI